MIAALGVYLVCGLTTGSEIRRFLPLNLIVVVGSALGIAQVTLDSGLAHAMAGSIIDVFSAYGSYGALIGIYAITLLLTEIITNNASAALVCPIAYSLAQSLGVDPTPFFVAVAFAASASFISPYGYQTNLMVYSAGKYRFRLLSHCFPFIFIFHIDSKQNMTGPSTLSSFVLSLRLLINGLNFLP